MTRRARLARTVVTAAVLVAAVTTGARACSGSTGTPVAQVASATTRVTPSSPPVPATTSKFAPTTTAHPVPTAKPTPVSISLTPRSSPLARSAPVRLQIAAIGVDSQLMSLGLRADGSMQVPPGGFPAGWYTGAPTPGELGPAIIAGHVDWNGPGVFHRLRSLRPGDQVTITRADGTKPVFRIARVTQFPKNQFPTQLVYGNIDHAGLRLITCGGSFDRQTGSYEADIVAFADLVATAL